MRQTLQDLARLAVQLEISSEEATVRVRPEDADRWQRAVQGDPESICAEDGSSLRALLRLLRHHRTALSVLLYKKGFDLDLDELDRSLTDGATALCVRRPWLWLRLKILRETPADGMAPAGISALAGPFGLDAERSVALRDAVVWSYCVHPEWESGAPPAVSDDADEAFRGAVESLGETLDAERRHLLREDAATRDALHGIGIEADACLALDAAVSYAARRRAAGDPRTASLVELFIEVLVADQPPEEFLPDVDWEALKQSLVEGDTQLLGSLADGRQLMRLVLRAVCAGPSAGGLPTTWFESIRQEYWETFRQQALRPGVRWVADALCLLAAVHEAAEADEPPPVLARYGHLLGLSQPAEYTDRAILDELTAALDALDVEAFHQAVPERAAEPMAVETLTNPPPVGGAAVEILGLQQGGLYDRVLAECDRPWVAGPEMSIQVEVLHDLLLQGLRNQLEDGGKFLERLSPAEAGVPPRELIAWFVSADRNGSTPIPTGRLLRFVEHNEHWLRGYFPVEYWRSSLLEAQIDDLRKRIGAEAAANPNSGLNIVSEILLEDRPRAVILRRYKLDSQALAALESAFYDGDAERLAEEILPKLAPGPGAGEENRLERVRQALLRTVTPLRVYLGLLAALILGYGIVHFVVRSWPLRQGPAPPPIPAPQDPWRSVLKELSVPEAEMSPSGMAVYVSPQPVTYEQYVRLMALPQKVAERFARTDVTQPVNFASYEEAKEYCSRLTQYLVTKYPHAFTGGGRLKGYACRLPTLQEARSRQFSVAAGPSRIDAEWIEPEGRSGNPRRAARRLLTLRTVRLLDSAGPETEQRARPGEQCTFRVVLAPRGAATK